MRLKIDTITSPFVFGPGRVPKIDILKTDGAFGNRKRLRIRLVGYRWYEVEDIEKASAASRGSGNGVYHPSDLPDWHAQYQHERQRFC